MFTKKTAETTQLEEIINKLESSMLSQYTDEEAFARDIKQLETLYKIKADNRPDRISKDQLALIAANLSGIVLILGYEKTHVVTSKALSFVMKSR